jgi:hypothetical protein
MKIVITIMLPLFFIGCIPSSSAYLYKSYELNTVTSVTVGSPMITVEEGYWQSQWGLPKTKRIAFSIELLYSGIANGAIHISYREYRESLARPAFYQDLQYEYKPEMLMTFQNYVLKIFEANAERINFAVINEPVKPYIEKIPSPPPDTIRINKM